MLADDRKHLHTIPSDQELNVLETVEESLDMLTIEQMYCQEKQRSHHHHCDVS